MGNFDFVYDNYDDSISRCLREAEKAFWVDYVSAGIHLRLLFERICKEIIRANGITVSTESKLKDMIDLINARGLFPRALRNDINYRTESGHKQKPWHFIWRTYGNACAHEDLDPDHPELCHENLLIVFTIVYDYFLNDASKNNKLPLGISTYFDAEKMPIGNNRVVSVVKSYHPLCEYELLTESLSDAGTLENYGIIRLFKKEDLRENINEIDAQTREYEIYVNKIRAMPSPCKRAEVLSKMDSPYSDYYIIKYEFEEKPYSLSNHFLNQLRKEQKIRLCRDLAVLLNEYHKAGVFHRNLNYCSIAVCYDGNQDPVPSIIKLEYAKDTNSRYTALPRLHARVQTESKIAKYEDPLIPRPPQKPTVEEWKQADIFSLGVLFRDILTDNILQTRPGARQHMQNKGIPKEIQELVCCMSSTSSRDRPDLSEIICIFDKYL